MKHFLTKISVLIFMLNLVLSATPSKPIATLMDTPASAFDMFLYNIQKRGECNSRYWGNPGGFKLNLCMTSLDYNYDDNLIKMKFFVSNNYKLIQDNKKEKIESLLKKIMSKVSQIVGVEHISWGKYYSGWIQNVTIRHGWGTKTVNLDEIRNEIRKRTEITLITQSINGIRYKVTRTHHGKVIIIKI